MSYSNLWSILNKSIAKKSFVQKGMQLISSFLGAKAPLEIAQVSLTRSSSLPDKILLPT